MPPSEALAISQIGQIGIPVRDLERATNFYKNVLGLPMLFQVPGIAFFQCGDVRLMLSAPEGPTAPAKASIIYYKVADLHSAFQSLGQHGVTVIDEPHLIATMPDHELWMFFLEDSEGNVLGLMSEVATK